MSKSNLPKMAGFNPNQHCTVVFHSDCRKKKCTIEVAFDAQSNGMMATPEWDPELVPGSKMELYAAMGIRFLQMIQGFNG